MDSIKSGTELAALRFGQEEVVGDTSETSFSREERWGARLEGVQDRGEEVNALVLDCAQWVQRRRGWRQGSSWRDRSG